MKKLALLAFSLCSCAIAAFSSLSDAEKWAAQHQEWLSPDQYTAFYKNSLSWPFSLFGFFEPERSFFQSLREVTSKRKEKGLYGRHVLTFRLSDPTSFIIVSNTQGDVHSFVRILEELHERGLLSLDFRLHFSYLILNGNAIGDSPYTIEMMRIILRLMEMNPDRFFYIRGQEEDKEYWVDRPLGERIAFLFSPFDRQRNELREFFNTLPLAFYIEDFQKPVRISYFSNDYDELEHLSCKKAHDEKDMGFCTLGDLCSYAQGPLSAIIVGTDKEVIWSSMKGLQWNKADGTWQVVSTPARQHRFFYDAFAQLDMGSSTQPSISLYASKKGSEFSSKGIFDLLTGQKRETIKRPVR